MCTRFFGSGGEIFSASGLIMRPQRARPSSEMLEILVYLKCNSIILENKKLIQLGTIDLFLRGQIIAGLGLDYCWSLSRTNGLGRQPVLVSKKLSGLSLEAGGLDINTVIHLTAADAFRPY